MLLFMAKKTFTILDRFYLILFSIIAENLVMLVDWGMEEPANDKMSNE